MDDGVGGAGVGGVCGETAARVTEALAPANLMSMPSSLVMKLLTPFESTPLAKRQEEFQNCSKIQETILL